MSQWEEVGTISQENAWEDASGIIESPTVSDSLSDVAELEQALERPDGLSQQVTPESVKAGEALEPDAGLEAPVISPEMVVGFAPQGVKAIGGEILGSVMADFGVESLDELLTDDFQKEYPTVSQAIKMAGGLAGGVVGSKAVPEQVTEAFDLNAFTKELDEVRSSNLTKEASIVAKFRNITPEQALKEVEGMPYQQQAKILAQAGKNNATTGVIKQALADGGDEARRIFAREIDSRIQGLNIAIHAGDAEESLKNAGELYGKMSEIASKGTVKTFDGTPLLNGLQDIQKLGARSDASERTIKALIKQFKDSKEINVEDLLTFRADINYELNRSTGKPKRKWLKLKNNLDSLIEAEVSPDMKKFIDDAVETYARAKNNSELAEVINKGQASEKVNWDKKIQQIKKAGLNSPETEKTLEMLNEYSKKFGTDLALFSSTATRGTTSESGGVLGAYGFVVNNLKNKLALWGERHDNLKAQKSILRAIKQSKDRVELADNLQKSEFTPDYIKKLMNENLDKLGDMTEGEIKKFNNSTLGIQPSRRTTNGRGNSEQVGLSEQLGQKELQDEINNRFGLDKFVGGEPTRPAQGESVSGLDALYGTQEVKTPSLFGDAVPTGGIDRLDDTHQSIRAKRRKSSPRFGIK